MQEINARALIECERRKARGIMKTRSELYRPTPEELEARSEMVLCSMRLDRETWEDAKRYAKENQTTASEVVRCALLIFLDAQARSE